MLAVIAGKLKSFWQFMKPRRRLGLVSFIILFTIFFRLFFSVINFANAQSTAGAAVSGAGAGVAAAAIPGGGALMALKGLGLSIPGVADGIINAFTSILLTIAELFIKLTIFILKFVIELGSYNGYIDSKAVTVGWVMVRDITNMGFIMILLLIAFGTILGLEQYEWKKLMVKLLLAAVLVNFSRIIAAVIIDAAQIVMITFINGVAATAGGNLIQMFKIDKMMSFGPGVNPKAFSSGAYFMSAVAALAFSAMMMATMAVFLVMLLARMVMLWVLIVLSPLAFVLNVIPQTQKYASQWWTDFGNNVISGPIIAFFLWLAFVTVGSGDIHSEIAGGSANSLEESMQDANKIQINPNQPANNAGITDVMTWTSMANFAIAIGMLMAGAKMAQQLGVMGGGLMNKAIDFGKKVAMVGSGIAAGRWAAKKGLEGTKKLGAAAGKGLYDITLGNSVERVKNWGQRQVEGYRDWRSQGPRMKRTELKAGEELLEAEKARGVQVITDEKGRRFKYDFERDAQGNVIDTRSGLQKVLHGRHEKLIKSRKLLEKVKNQTKTREELMDKRVTAAPSYFMQRFEGEEGVFRYDALDRIEQGQLEGEKARSQAKTEQFGGMGRQITKSNARWKDGKWQTKDTRGTISQQIQAHRVLAEEFKAVEEAGGEKNRAAYMAAHKGAMDQTAQANLKKGVNSAMVKALQSGAARDLIVGKTEGAPELTMYRQKAAAEMRAQLAEGEVKLREAQEKYNVMTKKVEEGGEVTAFGKIQATGLQQQATEAEIKEVEATGRLAEMEKRPELSERISNAEMGVSAADAFLKRIKEGNIAEIFKGGLSQLEDALKKLKEGGKIEDIIKNLSNKGARSAFAEQVSSYYQENISGIAKTKASDAAESLWTYNRTGNETPASAFRKSVGKRMEILKGEERERAVSMAVDSFKRLGLQRQEGQVPLEADQEAQFMASAQFLIENAWSDDMLARLVSVARENKAGKYAGNVRQEAEGQFIEDLLTKKLGWDINTNESSEKRTNDLHRLMAFAGDSGMLQSENAVLMHQRIMNKGKSEEDQLDYEQAARDLAEKTKSGTGLLTGEYKKMAEQVGASLGWSADRVRDQFVEFNNRFAKGSASADEAMQKFVTSIKKFNDQQELLTRMKSAAVSTTHIDDGGHAIFDMGKGYAHGQLSDDAMKFMLGDWIKVSALDRMRKLKSHAIGYMDEDYGTLHRLDEDRLAATFEGVDTQQKIEATDLRVNRHVVKHGASESFAKNEEGELLIGQENSAIRKRFKTQEEAMRDVARDWALMLKKTPHILLAKLASASGLSFEKGMSGQVNANLFGKSIKDLRSLVGWINEHVGEADQVDRRDIGKMDANRIIEALRKFSSSGGARRGKKKEDESVD